MFWSYIKRKIFKEEGNGKVKNIKIYIYKHKITEKHGTVYMNVTVTNEYITVYNFVCVWKKAEKFIIFEEIIPMCITAVVYNCFTNSKTIVLLNIKIQPDLFWRVDFNRVWFLYFICAISSTSSVITITMLFSSFKLFVAEHQHFHCNNNVTYV